MTLADAMNDAAAEVGAEVVREPTGATEFRRSGRTFATATDDAVEVLLDPEIAGAALRTPATAPSARGAGWVRLAASDAQPHDLDRAKAWFLSAWRNAERRN